jgi:tetratricopeptide (TPR) repeat protein
LEEITKAIEWDRSNANYWYKLARELMRIRNANTGNPDFDDTEKQRRQMQIIIALEEAVRLNPFKAEHHLQLGWEYTYMWQEPDADHKWQPAADLSMARAAYFAGDNNPYLHVMMGNYWLMRSKTVHPANTQWEIYWSKARWHYKKNLSLESGPDRKRMIEQIKRNVWVHYPDESFVKQAIDE